MTVRNRNIVVASVHKGRREERAGVRKKRYSYAFRFRRASMKTEEMEKENKSDDYPKYVFHGGSDNVEG